MITRIKYEVGELGKSEYLHVLNYLGLSRGGVDAFIM